MNGFTAAEMVAAKDHELLDWFETEVIACTQQENGWEIWYRGEDNEPATPEPVMFNTSGFREALAQAKEKQEAAIRDVVARGSIADRVDDAGGD